MKLAQTKDIRTLNRLAVLDYIRQHQDVSRAEVSEQLKLNKATVSTVVKEWIDLHLLRETELGSSTGGRKPIMLQQIANAGYCIAIDLGVTSMRVITTDLCNEVRQSHTIPLIGNQFAENYKHLYDYLDKTVQSMPPSPYGLVGIGVSVRGVVDREGVIRNIPNLRWRNIDIKTLLQERYHVPVTVNNDGNLMALAEQKHHPEYRELAVISIADVISTGLITNGELIQGYLGFANVLGHHTINFDETERCSCGKHGCWEQYCSNQAVIRQVNRYLEHPISRIEEFIALVRIQDEHALKVLQRFIKYLAVGLGNIIFILNSQTIVISSVIVSALPYLIPEVLRQIVLPITQTQDIFISELGDDSAILSASDQCVSGFFIQMANQ